MSKKILIVGDSWGCGEWQIGKGYQKNHPYGLEQLISKEYSVKNLSVPAGSNIMAINLIEKYHEKYDTIIWIVTEPSRNFEQSTYYQKKIGDFLIIDDKNSILEQSKTTIFNDIQKVKLMCEDKTIVVGGLHKIDQEYHAGFKKVINWVDLLNGLHLKTYYIGSQIYKEVYFPTNLEVDDDDNKKRQEFNNHMYSTREFFYPDGVHPNKKSYEILYNFIKDYI